jgi:hypothetical protein
VAEDEKTEGTSPAAATEGVTPDAIGERIDAAVEDGVDVPVPTVEAAVETPSDPEIGAEIDAAVETAAASAPRRAGRGAVGPRPAGDEGRPARRRPEAPQDDGRARPVHPDAQGGPRPGRAT